MLNYNENWVCAKGIGVIKRQKVCLIGAGKVGKSLKIAFDQAGYQCNLVGKDLSEQQRVAAAADLILLTVQDSFIQTVCEDIAGVLNLKHTVAHCSGALGSQVLTAAKAAGCSVGSAHPLNTFPNLAAAEALLCRADHDTACFVSGDNKTRATLSTIFSDLGFNISVLEDDQAKIAYHAACVFACNYLSSLAELSLQTAEQAGLEREQFWQALQPLMTSTLSNITQHGTAFALSGPIARGDINTVEKHLNILPNSMQSAYKALGQQALELAKQRSELDNTTLELIAEKLT